MIQNEKLRVAVNRVMSFLIGGLLVFAVMSLTVVSKTKDQNVQLTKELDASRYEAGRLLADAKAQYANKDFAKTQQTLTTLFEKQPGSTESVEGQKLYAQAGNAIAKDNANWEAAVGGIRERWARDLTAQLRAQSDTQRKQMETDLNDTLAKEWEKMKDQVRQEWAKQQG
jgi:hypothetical protein